jgi:hypothetical protein
MHISPTCLPSQKNIEHSKSDFFEENAAFNQAGNKVNGSGYDIWTLSNEVQNASMFF